MSIPIKRSAEPSWNQTGKKPALCIVAAVNP